MVGASSSLDASLPLVLRGLSLSLSLCLVKHEQSGVLLNSFECNRFVYSEQNSGLFHIASMSEQLFSCLSFSLSFYYVKVFYTNLESETHLSFPWDL